MQNHDFEKLIHSNPQAAVTMLESLLDDERNKPDAEKDYDRIAALTAAISSVYMSEDSQDQAEQSGVEAVLHRTAEKPQRISRPKWLCPVSAACACLILLFGLNAWSVRATGANLWKRIYAFWDGSVAFTFNSEEHTDSAVPPLPVQEDPFGIRAECEKYGLSPRVPQYLPEGFAQKNAVCNDTEDEHSLMFDYRKADACVQLYYRLYPDAAAAQNSKWMLPSETQGLSELEFSGVTVTVTQIGQQYWAMYRLDNVVCAMLTENLDFTESEKILRSMLE